MREMPIIAIALFIAPCLQAKDIIRNWAFDVLQGEHIETYTYFDPDGSPIAEVTMYHVGTYSEDGDVFVTETTVEWPWNPGEKEATTIEWKLIADEIVGAAHQTDGTEGLVRTKITLTSDRTTSYTTYSPERVIVRGITTFSETGSRSEEKHFGPDGKVIRTAVSIMK